MDRRNLLKALAVAPIGGSLLQAIGSPDFPDPKILPLPDGFKARSGIAGAERLVQMVSNGDGTWDLWQGTPTILRIVLSEYDLQDMPDDAVLWDVLDGVRIEDPATHEEVKRTALQVRDEYCVTDSLAWDVVGHVGPTVLGMLGCSVNSRDFDTMDTTQTKATLQSVAPTDFFGYKREPNKIIYRKTNLLPPRFHSDDCLDDEGKFLLEVLEQFEIDEPKELTQRGDRDDRRDFRPHFT